jgi:hypothetical protein
LVILISFRIETRVPDPMEFAAHVREIALNV